MILIYLFIKLSEYNFAPYQNKFTLPKWYSNVYVSVDRSITFSRKNPYNNSARGRKTIVNKIYQKE